MSEERYFTPIFTVDFPAISKPKINKKKPADAPKYGCVAIFDPGTDLSELRKIEQAKLVERWPDPAKRPRNPAFRKNEERAIGPEGGPYTPKQGYPLGGHFAQLTSIYPPGIVDANCQPILDLSKIYAGCKARAEVNVYAFDTDGNRGVRFGLSNFQLMGDGPRIVTRPDASSVFKAAPAVSMPAGADQDDDHDPLG